MKARQHEISVPYFSANNERCKADEQQSPAGCILNPVALQPAGPSWLWKHMPDFSVIRPTAKEMQLAAWHQLDKGHQVDNSAGADHCSVVMQACGHHNLCCSRHPDVSLPASVQCLCNMHAHAHSQVLFEFASCWIWVHRCHKCSCQEQQIGRNAHGLTKRSAHSSNSLII